MVIGPEHNAPVNPFDKPDSALCPGRYPSALTCQGHRLACPQFPVGNKPDCVLATSRDNCDTVVRKARRGTRRMIVDAGLHHAPAATAPPVGSAEPTARTA